MAKTTLTEPARTSNPTARTCDRCGKTKGVMFHAMQMADGRMRSVCAHTPCFKKMREEEQRRRLGNQLLGTFKVTS